MVHNAGQYVGITSDNADGLTAGMLGFGDGSMLSADGGSTNLATMRYYQRLYGDAYIDLMEHEPYNIDMEIRARGYQTLYRRWGNYNTVDKKVRTGA